MRVLSDVKIKEYVKKTPIKIEPFSENILGLARDFIGNGIVFDWYPYMQDFSGKFVYEMFNRFHITPEHKVLDPYCGSGTTLLTAKLLGIDSTGIDFNPFCCFISKVKTNWEIPPNELQQQARRLLGKISSIRVLSDSRIEPPKMPNLDRWMAKKIVYKVLAIKNLIYDIQDENIKDFFLLALASILREVSNITLALNVTINSIKTDAPVFSIFANKVHKMVEDYRQVRLSIEKPGSTQVFRKDSRHIDLEEVFDFVITSPPYPNDIDYVNQTRMELFFLDLITNKNEFRDLKRGMITSDAIYYVWAKNNSELVEDIPEITGIVKRMKESYKNKGWGWDYPKMVSEYFGDMLLSLDSLYDVMAPGGYCVYVVGDAAFNGIKIPADNLIKVLAEKVGFSNCIVERSRSRSASSHRIPLRESLVIFRK